jgi:fucose permease
MLPLVKLLTDSKGRSDLGNAKISGMDKELHLTPKQYSNVGSIFFVGYIVLQLPATLLVRKIGPPLQVCYTLMLFPPWSALH